MLHQRRLPPRDVSRNSQSQRGQERSLSRGSVKKPSIDSMARTPVTASGSRHRPRARSGLVPFSPIAPPASPLAAHSNRKPNASVAGRFSAAIDPKIRVDASLTAWIRSTNGSSAIPATAAASRALASPDALNQDEDHHRIDIYFTPPGEKERLIDRKFYSRVEKPQP